MLPLENTIDIKGPYSEKENQYHFSSLLTQLQSHFNELFEIRNNALLLLQQLHPKIRTTWHTHGYIMTVVDSISPTYPSLQFKLSLKKRKADNTASPTSIDLYLDIHCKQPSLPPQYQDSHQAHSLPAATIRCVLLEVASSCTYNTVPAATIPPMPQHTTHKLPIPQQPQYLVYNEHTLCCTLPYRPATLGVIAVKKTSDLNQHSLNQTRTRFLPPHAKLRPATLQDFHHFKVNPPTVVT